MDLSDTLRQVEGGRFQVCKFVDLSGTPRQVQGPLVYLTLNFICKNDVKTSQLLFINVYV
jgi:hypothetical protein